MPHWVGGEQRTLPEVEAGVAPGHTLSSVRYFGALAGVHAYRNRGSAAGKGSARTEAASPARPATPRIPQAARAGSSASEYKLHLIAEVGQGYHIGAVVVGMEHAKAACAHQYAVFAFQDVAVEALLQCVVPVGGVVQVLQRCEGAFAEAVDGLFFSVAVDQVGRALPVVYLVASVVAGQEVESACQAVADVENAPIRCGKA